MEFEKMVDNPTVRRSYVACSRESPKLLIMVIVLLNGSCASGHVSQSPALDPVKSPSAVASPSRSAETTPYVPDQLGEPIGDFIKIYTKGETLSFKGYEVVKSRRESKIGPPKGVTDI